MKAFIGLALLAVCAFTFTASQPIEAEKKMEPLVIEAENENPGVPAAGAAVAARDKRGVITYTYPLTYTADYGYPYYFRTYPYYYNSHNY